MVVGACDNAGVAIRTRFTQLFGCRYPVQQAGMGGFSSPALAIAVSNAGGLGMLTGTMGKQTLSAQLDAVPVDATVGVNFLMPFLDRSAVEEAAGLSALVEFFWAAPDAVLVDEVHGGGAR